VGSTAASSNGVPSDASLSAVHVAPVILPVPVGRSLYGRLCALAQAEGVDPVTLAVQMLSFQAGVASVRPTTRPAPRRPDLEARLAVVCIMCGRERVDPTQTHCAACGGRWVSASA
jgi:hypothetical protein